MAASRQHQRKAKALTFYVIVGLAIAAGVVVWKSSIFGSAPIKLNAELRKAREDGLPLNAEDIRRTIVVADNENAAPILKLAFAERKAFEATHEGKELAKLTQPSNAVLAVKSDELDKIAPTLTHLSRLFSLLNLASLKPKLDYNRQWELGPALLVPEFAEEKSVVAPLILKSRVDLKEGRPLEALHALRVAARISALVGQEPILIGLFVQVALRSQVCHVLSEVLKEHATVPGVLDQSRVILNELGPMPDVRPAIRSEFYSARVAVQMLAKQGNAEVFGEGGGNTVGRLARFGPIRTVYDLRVTQTYHNLYKALSVRPGSIIQMQKAFTETQVALDGQGSKDWTYGLVEILAPVFTNMAGALGESEARRDVLLSALDLLETKQKTGAFPEKLSNLSKYSLDPFTERPLTYHKTKSGFLIYSFGKDGKDDGGKPRSPKSKEENYDIPFEFP